MAIADAEKMEGWQALDIGSQNVLILVDFVWVVRVVPNSSGECELSHAVLALFVVLLLRRCSSLVVGLGGVLERAGSPRRVIGLRELLAHDHLLSLTRHGSRLLLEGCLTAWLGPCNRWILLVAFIWASRSGQR